MRTLISDWINDRERWILVMVERKDKDPIFYLYYNYVDETEIQRTKYTIDRRDIHYYTGGAWHTCG